MLSKRRTGDIICRAYESLNSFDITSFPVPILDVYDFLGIKCIPYSKTEPRFRSSIVAKIQRSHLDGFCWKAENHYIVFYDDSAYAERIPFTLAHELGHIILKHHSRSRSGVIPRYTFTGENDALEREADLYAGELLRPAYLISILELQTSEIEAVFHVSRSCAKVGLSLAKRIFHSSKNKKAVSQFFEPQLSNFIDDSYCLDCHYRFPFAGASYCPICGDNKLCWGNQNQIRFQFSPTESELPTIMKYKEYTEQAGGKAKFCVQCGEEINSDDDFCPICGLPTKNKCGGNTDTRLVIDCFTPGCGATVPLNARYCPYCGCETTYSQAQALSPWQVERQQILDAQQSVDDIF